MSDKVKIYPWYDFKTAMEKSGKSLAELFDFKSGLLIDYIENQGEKGKKGRK